MQTATTSATPAVATLPANRLAMSINEACEALGVSRTTIYAEVRSGRLRLSKVGGQRGTPRKRSLLSISELERWLAAAQDAPSTPRAA